jgi:hypothetical protein
MSIDRRSFVQSAVAAVGGATSLASDASAQTNLRLAQAYVEPSIAATCPGPHKPYGLKPGDQTQRNYEFLKELFDPATQKTFRDALWGYNDPTLRNIIKGFLDIDLPPTTKILLVDAEFGRMKDVSGNFNPASDCWYVLLLPPVPRGFVKPGPGKIPEDGYLYEMTWEAAWHHAIAYGYGM